MFAQLVPTSVDHTVTGWEVMLALVVGLPGLLAAVLSYFNGARLARQADAIKDTNEGVQGVHGMLNSQLSQWKEQIAAQNKRDLESQGKAFDAAVELAKSEAKAVAMAETVELEKRIAGLEAMMKLKDVIQAVALEKAKNEMPPVTPPNPVEHIIDAVTSKIDETTQRIDHTTLGIDAKIPTPMSRQSEIRGES
jgi:flagellar biosynthesis/type III secretory pathway ATPase